MEGVMAIRSLVRAHWQETWNQYVRFSKLKLGIWMLMGQVGVTTLIIKEMAAGYEIRLWMLALGMLLVTSVKGIMEALEKAQSQLYHDRFLHFVHISAAPPSSLLVASLIIAMPVRIFSSMLIAAALSSLLPSDQWLYYGPLLWLVGVISTTLAHAVGLVLLIRFVILAPGGLGMVRILALVFLLGGVAVIVYFLFAGSPVEAIISYVNQAQQWIVVMIVIFVLLPGLWTSYRLFFAPHRLGNLYKSSWMRVIAQAEPGAKIRKSSWPAMSGGAAGSIQAKDWLLAARSKITLLRLGIFFGGTIAAYFIGAFISEMAEPMRSFTVISAAMIVLLFSLGEIPAAAFSGEGANISFYAIAGTRPSQLLLGKIIASFPLGWFGSAVSTWAFAANSGYTAIQQMQLVLIGSLLGASSVLILIGAAAAGISRKDMEKSNVNLPAEIIEQVPRGVGAWLGIFISMGFSAAGAWIGVGGIKGMLAAVAGVVLVGVVVLPIILGYLRLRSLLLRGK